MFALDEASRELVSLHPGVTLDEVQKNTGFTLRVSPTIGETALPTPQELRILRREIDPLGMRHVEFVAGKERGPLLMSLIEAEEAAVRATSRT